jgi:hypothetical protein
MKITPKIAALLTVPAYVSVATACGGPLGQPSSTSDTSASAAASTTQTTQALSSGSPSVDSSAGGNGPATNNQIDFDPEDPLFQFLYNFGTIIPGGSSTLQFTVDNDFKQLVQISISTTSQYFTPSQNCDGPLIAGASCAYSITFRAPVSGTYDANLIIAFNGSPLTAGALEGIVGVKIIEPIILRTFIGSTPLPTTGLPTQTASSPTPSTSTSAQTTSTSVPSASSS